MHIWSIGIDVAQSWVMGKNDLGFLLTAKKVPTE
jgi:hypothetical protein